MNSTPSGRGGFDMLNHRGEAVASTSSTTRGAAMSSQGSWRRFPVTWWLLQFGSCSGKRRRTFCAQTRSRIVCLGTRHSAASGTRLECPRIARWLKIFRRTRDGASFCNSHLVTPIRGLRPLVSRRLLRNLLNQREARAGYALDFETGLAALLNRRVGRAMVSTSSTTVARGVRLAVSTGPQPPCPRPTPPASARVRRSGRPPRRRGRNPRRRGG